MQRVGAALQNGVGGATRGASKGGVGVEDFGGMGGIANQQNELLTDGVPNTTWDGRLAYSPPKDAVSEVRRRTEVLARAGSWRALPA